MRKTPLQNKTIHQQSKLLTLSSRALYLKPQINSFHSNLAIRNASSTMNRNDATMHSANAEQTASSEAKAAGAAYDVDMDVENDSSVDQEDDLIDYKELDVDNVQRTSS